MAGFLVWFWNERFWLPHNVTWADLKNTEESTFPQAEDLYVACPLAFFIFIIRLVFERFIARPCALGLKIQANGPRKAQANAILEKVFTAITMHPDEKRLEGLSKQLDWDVRTIQRWFRQRRNQEKPSTLTRFCESMWRFTFYLYIFTYGVRYLKKTPWLWNTRECWYNYPYQALTVDLHYYYILELSFYLSLLFSQFTDIRRKDCLLMFMHHVATVSLIMLSYVNNMARVGTLVLCLHDASDVLLEAAKMANYAKYQRLCNVLFIMFALVFISSRLGLYPVWILNTTLFESWEIVGPYPSWCQRMTAVTSSQVVTKKKWRRLLTNTTLTGPTGLTALTVSCHLRVTMNTKRRELFLPAAACLLVCTVLKTCVSKQQGHPSGTGGS
ncbi:ceramide synthase 6 isoform X2 [Hemibagrus wyckioides]|uniref:ceramide synthase 6 isoform X2 n=1 Tax=Hemibagrus wyckioides TaxID=337641 RepID=UPI00266B8725|nr:ceramide synthase 6 isoform X2 [Hemibagrus wyckioides]